MGDLIRLPADYFAEAHAAAEAANEDAEAALNEEFRIRDQEARMRISLQNGVAFGARPGELLYFYPIEVCIACGDSVRMHAFGCKRTCRCRRTLQRANGEGPALTRIPGTRFVPMRLETPMTTREIEERVRAFADAVKAAGG